MTVVRLIIGDSKLATRYDLLQKKITCFLTYLENVSLFFQGCSYCNCSEGSIDSQCDQETGECECKDGVTGPQCQRCQAGFWNLGPDGM